MEVKTRVQMTYGLDGGACSSSDDVANHGVVCARVGSDRKYRGDRIGGKECGGSVEERAVLAHGLKKLAVIGRSGVFPSRAKQGKLQPTPANGRQCSPRSRDHQRVIDTCLSPSEREIRLDA